MGRSLTITNSTRPEDKKNLMTATFIFDAFEVRRISLEVAGAIEYMISKVEGLNSRNKTGKKK